MLRLLFTRRWLLGSLAAVAFGVACFFLGQWQWGRHVEQQAKVAAIRTNYDAAPVPLAAALAAGPLTLDRQWTRVTLTGTYAAGRDLFVRNRTIDQTVGLEVLTPFTTDGQTLLVDRGWVPNADDATTVPPVDAPVSGQVTVTGWLRTGEPDLGRDLPLPQLASISTEVARASMPELSPLDLYVVAGSQSPDPFRGAHPLTALLRPEEDLGPHQAYAYQWWLFMPGGLVFVFWALRREAQGVRDAETEVKAAGSGEDPLGRDGQPWPDDTGDPAGDPAGVLVARTPRKAKKVRIWDEEDG